MKTLKNSDRTKNNLFNIYVNYAMYKFSEDKGIYKVIISDDFFFNSKTAVNLHSENQVKE